MPTVIAAVAADRSATASPSASAPPRGSTLAQVEATPAVHVGEHEPANTKIIG